MKTIAFIDASNIIYGTRDEGWKVDFKKLYKYLCERYELVLKPVKIFTRADGSSVRKANCDVDLTFYTMCDKDLFSRAIFMTGDGDFEILLKYLIEIKKEVVVIANGKRTAREIKQLIGERFASLGSLKQLLEYKKRQTH